jgi:hypothetical protein
MLVQTGAAQRELNTVHTTCDLAVVGGGLAGACCAITAARSGLKVVLIQDRPVLGGNASSEVRLWVLGATSHMGNNNRWAREGGVIDEILVENTYRNPEGNPLLFDTVLLEKVVAEDNITLLLNCAAFEVTKTDADTIGAVRAFCSQNSTMYQVKAPLFVDASGDGVLGFLAGAAFRMGAESRDEFGEKWAPEKASSELLGHTIYFYSRDAGRPVTFVPPAFALKDITQIPRWKSFNAKEFGCQLWWLEHGGRLDTVHQTETIKWDLWKVVYGVWNHIKNSGQFPEAKNLTLEWVGTIPGKRESRRFEGDLVLTQQDIVEQRRHHDAVSFGGWAIDLHPADGVFSEKPGCTQWHAKGVYQIPYRCMYSRNIANLFLAGRIISASHIAFGSTRVMATCAHNAQAVGMAAAICRRDGLLPRDLADETRVAKLQNALLRAGQHIPHVQLAAADDDDARELARTAKVTASSTLALRELPASGEFVKLDRGRAMLLPLQAGPVPEIRIRARGKSGANLVVQLRTCSRDESFTPDEVLEAEVIELGSGAAVAATASASTSAVSAAVSAVASVPTAARNGATQPAAVDELVSVKFDTILETARYAMVCFMPNADIELAVSDRRVTGVLSLTHSVNLAVSKSAVQTPPADIGIDSFEFWLPERRPNGKNLSAEFFPPIKAFHPDNVQRGPERPTNAANAWVAGFDDAQPALTFEWTEPKTIASVTLCVDNDFDHPMESVLMGHPERTMPFCVPSARIKDERGNVVATLSDNHQTRVKLDVGSVTTRSLRIEVDHPAGGNVPAALFRVWIDRADNASA